MLKSAGQNTCLLAVWLITWEPWGMLRFFFSFFPTSVCQGSLSNFTGTCDYFVFFCKSVKAQTLPHTVARQQHFHIKMNVAQRFVSVYIIFFPVIMRVLSIIVCHNWWILPPVECFPEASRNHLIWKSSLTTNGFSVVYGLHMPALLLALCATKTP